MLVRSTQYAMKQSFQRCAGVQVARDKQLGGVLALAAVVYSTRISFSFTCLMQQYYYSTIYSR